MIVCRTQVTPINYNLMIVNMFMAMTAGYQLYRKMYSLFNS